MLEFDSDDAMQKKWKAFIKKINTKTDDFKTVLKTIKLFLAEPFSAAVENKKFNSHWTANDNQWKEGV